MTTKRKVLGRGLNALLPSAAGMIAEKAFVEIPIEDVIPNKYQPRAAFGAEQLRSLAQSIKSNGIVQPLIVRRSGSKYQLIAGERRWRAAQLAGLKAVPAVIRDVSEYKSLELALIENIQRQDLNPIEEATAYFSLVQDFELTQEEVAQRVGKDRSSVANYLRLLKLPDDIKEKIQRQELSMGHARAISALENASDQLTLADRIVAEQLNVRQAEHLVRDYQTTKKSGTEESPKKATPKVDPNIHAAEQRHQEAFGTRVLIQTHQRREGGKIEIWYENSDDLIRIFDLLLKNASDANQT
jgi:ParB family chromosome partitioning protein